MNKEEMRFKAAAMAMQGIFNPLNISDLRELLSYDPKTGELKRLKNRKKTPVQNRAPQAGWTDKDGYRVVSIRKKKYFAHRVAWAIFYGKDPNREIDHINGDPGDNRIDNLRLATRAENSQNRWIPSRNTSGSKGVCWVESRKKWQAQICVAGKYCFLGRFYTREAAESVYNAAAARLHGEFAKVPSKIIAWRPAK
jgi:hypothetical protein